MRLYPQLSAAFCTLVVLSNLLSAKMVSLFGLSLPAGIFTYPLTLLLSNGVNELYGAKLARQMVYTGLGMVVLSLGVIELGLWLPSTEAAAFKEVFSLSRLRIGASLAAFLTSQLAEVALYARLKRWQGCPLWLRSSGAVGLAQLVDTLFLDLIFLCWGMGWALQELLPVILFSYSYKALSAIAFTPLLYLLLRLDPRKREGNL